MGALDPIYGGVENEGRATPDLVSSSGNIGALPSYNQLKMRVGELERENNGLKKQIRMLNKNSNNDDEINDRQEDFS